MPTSLNTAVIGHRTIPTGHGASRRLADILRSQLASGKYAPGEQLPTQRMLMQSFNVGYSVANRAMEILAREGLIDRRQGQGTFVCEGVQGPDKSGRLDAFALVLAYSRWSFNLSLFQGLNAAANQLHCQTIVCDTEQNVDRQASILMQFIDQRVAGIAIVPTVEPETPGYQIRACQRSGIPVVLLHRGVKGVSAPLISLPFEQIGYELGKAVRDRGHRRVVCVYDERYVGTEQYEAGLRRALEEGGDKPDIRLFYSGKRSVPISPKYEHFLENILVSMARAPRESRPTAIIVGAEDAAGWIYMRLIKMGVRLPEEMSLLTIGSALRQHVLDEQVTAVTIDEAGVGRLAARLLSEMGRGERPIEDREQFTAKLDFHAGRTLGPAPAIDRDGHAE